MKAAIYCRLSKEDEDKKKINIYSYLDVYSDDYTSKDTIDIDKIYDALG